MSRSAGPGSPIAFKCHRERDTLRFYSQPHVVELTGRSKPYRAKRYHALGARSTSTTREYRCITCGHVGWSNHVDLARLAGRAVNKNHAICGINE